MRTFLKRLRNLFAAVAIWYLLHAVENLYRLAHADFSKALDPAVLREALELPGFLAKSEIPLWVDAIFVLICVWIALGMPLRFRDPGKAGTVSFNQTASLLTVRRPKGLKRHSTYPLGDLTTTIGRQGDCDIVLNNKEVSRLHAVIERQGNEEYSLRDERSRIGTRVRTASGRTIQLQNKQEYLLQHGDCILIGPVELNFTEFYVTPTQVAP